MPADTGANFLTPRWSPKCQDRPKTAKRLLTSNLFALENRLKIGFVSGTILVDVELQNGLLSRREILCWGVWKLTFFASDFDVVTRDPGH